MTIENRSWLSERARQMTIQMITPILEELTSWTERASLGGLIDFFLDDPIVRMIVLWIGPKLLRRSFLYAYAHSDLEDRLINRVYQQLEKSLPDATYLEALLDDYMLRRASWEPRGLSEKERFSEASEFWSAFVKAYLELRRNND